MLDFLFSLGQAASALLIVYGGYLTLGQTVPMQKDTPVITPALEDA
jgi:hypothetical protein